MDWAKERFGKIRLWKEIEAGVILVERRNAVRNFSLGHSCRFVASDLCGDVEIIKKVKILFYSQKIIDNKAISIKITKPN